jgi:hypothetical protein
MLKVVWNRITWKTSMISPGDSSPNPNILRIFIDGKYTWRIVPDLRLGSADRNSV